MRYRLCLFLALLLCAPAAVDGQTQIDAERSKQAIAIRVSDGAIRVDGRLDDQAWHQAAVIDDFTQKEPVEGAPPTERMEVRFAYDDNAVYVGARLYSSDPSTIQAPLGRRDNLGTQAEHFFVSL